ncbi:glycosyltransferase [Pontibacillus salicampi]|uniref:Glycosyltransferase n=1 Tax=Pontibacillus salicampi TaxID=1449801 RepID=A0ABV6LQM7_9BACI
MCILNPIVSVILTSYNKPSTVGKAIESVLSQTLQNFELWIMDDHSSSETKAILQRYVSDKRVHLVDSGIADHLRYQTTRYATLINEALPRTKGKYITYLTDDNLFKSTRFKRMVNVLESRPSTEVVYSKQQVIHLDEHGSVTKKFIRHTNGKLRNPVGLVDHCSIMHTRGIAEKVFHRFGSYWDDGPENWYNGDAAFWKRLTNFTLFHPIPEILDVAYKDTQSFQHLYQFIPEDIPTGVIIQTPSSELYRVENGTRRLISPEIMQDLHYNQNKIVVVPAPFLFKYPEGAPINRSVFTNSSTFPDMHLIKSASSPTVYMYQKGKKHPLPNEEVFYEFHFNWNEIVNVSDHLLLTIPTGAPITSLHQGVSILPDGVLFRHHQQYYVSNQQALCPIHAQVAERLHYPTGHSVVLSTHQISSIPIGEEIRWNVSFR